MTDLVRLAVLDVGNGDSLVVILPDGDTAIVIDTPNGRTTLQYLVSHGVKSIPYVFVTHCDEDHYGGIIDLIINLQREGVELGCICYVESKIMEERSPRYKTFLRQLIQLEETVRPILPYSSTPISISGPAVKIVYPCDNNDTTCATLGRTSNNASIILSIAYHQYRLLLGGDLEEEGWYRLVGHARQDGFDLRSDFLKYPHHGAWLEAGGQRISTPELLDIVKPRYVALSIGTNNGNNHPSPETLKALSECQFVERVFCTQMTALCCGSEDIRNIRNRMPDQIAQFASQDRRQCPCCGTIELEVGQHGISWSPSKKSHDAFICTLSNPQCRGAN